MEPKTVVIVGGGFSGIVTAINLVRFAAGPLRISVINKTGPPCRGIAYGTDNRGHLLNVVARNMSALADQPNHFVQWLTTRSEFLAQPVQTLRETFVPRQIYGDYIHGLFHWHETVIAPDKEIQLAIVPGEVTDISLDNGQASVQLADGCQLRADKVILALGNQPPAELRAPGLSLKSARYINNPWQDWENALPPSDQDILLVGTGLTMLDVLVSLLDREWRGRIYATSRHGLLPLCHFQGQDFSDFFVEGFFGKPLRQMFREFKLHYRKARAAGVNPAMLVDKLRPFTQRLWQELSPPDKKRFNRHLRPRWNPMRHRIAPALHRLMQDAIRRDRLQVLKGRLSACEESESAIKVTIERDGQRHTVEAGAVINCTGPRESYISGELAVIRNMLSRGMAQPDEMNLGIKVDANFGVVDANGTTSQILFALGGILKGTLWESVAVPELRSQAFRIAETICNQLAVNQAERLELNESLDDVIEYSI